MIRNPLHIVLPALLFATGCASTIDRSRTVDAPVERVWQVLADEYAQVALIPIAYTKGTDFKAGPRKDLDAFLHTNSW